MVSFAATAFASPLAVALFVRLLEEGKLRFVVPLALLLPLLLMTHVWAFATLVVPMTALYVRAWRKLGWGGHARVWAVALAAVAGNLFWLLPVLAHIELISFSGKVGQANPTATE
jgi:hypothetical protein